MPYLDQIFYVAVVPTWRCNFRCKACYRWKILKHHDIPIEKWLKIIKNLKRNFSSNVFVEIDGGEALIRKADIIRIIKELKTQFKRVVLNTNGSLLDEKTLLKLDKLGLDAIKLSFYSLNKKTHNYLRGVDCYDAVLSVIKNHQKLGLKLELIASMLVTSKNIEEIPALIKFLMPLNRVNFRINPLQENFYSENAFNHSSVILPKDLWPTKEKIKKLFSWLAKYQERFKTTKEHLRLIENYYLNPKSSLKIPCRVSTGSFIVHPSGGVSLCYSFPEIGSALGNLKKILNSSAARKQRKEIEKCRKYCRILTCSFVNQNKDKTKNNPKQPRPRRVNGTRSKTPKSPRLRPASWNYGRAKP